MKKEDNIIRVGDIVQITNPELVTRIGYAFSYEDAFNEIKASYEHEINVLMRKVKVHYKRWDVVQDAVIKPLAYELVRSKFKYGNERKLHTTRREELQDVQATVIRKKVAKTGIYFPPTGGYDTNAGDYDYEPGGLKDCKTHVLLEFGFPGKLSRKEELLIEQRNVIKVNV